MKKIPQYFKYAFIFFIIFSIYFIFSKKLINIENYSNVVPTYLSGISCKEGSVSTGQLGPENNYLKAKCKNSSGMWLTNSNKRRDTCNDKFRNDNGTLKCQ